MAADWSRPLARPLGLKSGEELVTLRDAGELFDRSFGNVRRDAAIEHAIELLMAAAKTGRKADVAAATDQVALALKLRRLA
jgi:hypothetical protein